MIFEEPDQREEGWKAGGYGCWFYVSLIEDYSPLTTERDACSLVNLPNFLILEEFWLQR